jgi:YbgC/YbaW family acyl-CoA thioester hydrolase
MAYEFKSKRQVQFAETDMAGIAHFTNFFRYMEETEHAFYRSLGFSVDMERADKSLGLGWPRVRAECEYKHPLRFEDEFEVHLLVAEIKSKTIRQAQGDNDPARDSRAVLGRTAGAAGRRRQSCKLTPTARGWPGWRSR